MFSAMIKGFTEDKGVIDFIHAVWARKSGEVRQNSLEEVRRRQRAQHKLSRVAFS